MTLRGVFTALITPMAGEAIDFKGLSDNVADQLLGGVDGLVVLGSTGECSTVLLPERAPIIKTVVNAAKGAVPIAVGIGDSSTLLTREKALQAEDCGADLLLLCMPSYVKPTQEGLIRHVEAVAEAVNLPIILYNQPGRTGVNLLPKTVLQLAQDPRIIGLKDSTGGIDQIAAVLSSAPSHFVVMCGDDALILPMMSLGAQGVISVLSNLVPQMVVKLVQAFANGQIEDARKLHFQLYPLMQAAFIETNPVPIKAAMHLIGKAAGKTRMPLCELHPQNLLTLKQVLHDMGLLTTALAGR